MFQIRLLNLVVLNKYEALAALTAAEVVLETLKKIDEKKTKEIADLKEALDRSRTNYAALKSAEVRLTKEKRELQDALQEALAKYK
jgi:histidinol-phosphate/aromatic aminotransferase/cobyric acid decarboxylase-like protein